MRVVGRGIGAVFRVGTGSGIVLAGRGRYLYWPWLAAGARGIFSIFEAICGFFTAARWSIGVLLRVAVPVTRAAGSFIRSIYESRAVGERDVVYTGYSSVPPSGVVDVVEVMGVAGRGASSCPS